MDPGKWIGPGGYYSILNVYTKTLLQPLDGDCDSGTYLVGSAIADEDDKFQAWFIEWKEEANGYTLRNCATPWAPPRDSRWASATQVKPPVAGREVVQMNAESDIFQVSRGTYTGSFFMWAKKKSPWVLEVHDYNTGDDAHVVTAPYNPRPTPPGSTEKVGNANQQWCFIELYGHAYESP